MMFGSAIGGSLIGSKFAFSQSETIGPLAAERKPFLLYVHLGSVCGISSGLVQPIEKGKWPKGFFKKNSDGESDNPLINQHIGSAGSDIILHQYNQWLAEISDDLCLMNGKSLSLDHNLAQPLRRTGSPIPNFAPEWGMALAQNTYIAKGLNPYVISQAAKTNSTSDITTFLAQSYDQFVNLTKDHSASPEEFQNFKDIYIERFNKALASGTRFTKDQMSIIDRQLTILKTGALDKKPDEIKSLELMLDGRKFNNELRRQCSDWRSITYPTSFKDQLVLAGTLAQTGLGAAMTITENSYDLHGGGSEIDAARGTASTWIMLSQFWKWAKSVGLDNDITVLVSHDFGRSPHNNNFVTRPVYTSENKREDITSQGRDHDPHMGMLVFNAKAKVMGGRVGVIDENLTPRGGTIGSDPSPGYLTTDLVGSMLMRIYPELFPTERIIRKFYNTFSELTSISSI